MIIQNHNEKRGRSAKAKYSPALFLVDTEHHPKIQISEAELERVK